MVYGKRYLIFLLATYLDKFKTAHDQFVLDDYTTRFYNINVSIELRHFKPAIIIHKVIYLLYVIIII